MKVKTCIAACRSHRQLNRITFELPLSLSLLLTHTQTDKTGPLVRRQNLKTFHARKWAPVGATEFYGPFASGFKSAASPAIKGACILPSWILPSTLVVPQFFFTPFNAFQQFQTLRSSPISDLRSSPPPRWKKKRLWRDIEGDDAGLFFDSIASVLIDGYRKSYYRDVCDSKKG